jgi:hypothetical protein
MNSTIFVEPLIIRIIGIAGAFGQLFKYTLPTNNYFFIHINYVMRDILSHTHHYHRYRYWYQRSDKCPKKHH